MNEAKYMHMQNQLDELKHELDELMNQTPVKQPSKKRHRSDEFLINLSAEMNQAVSVLSATIRSMGEHVKIGNLTKCRQQFEVLRDLIKMQIGDLHENL